MVPSLTVCALVELPRCTFQPDKTFHFVSSFSSFLPLARHVGPSHLHISAWKFISQHVRFRFLRGRIFTGRIYKDRPSLIRSTLTSARSTTFYLNTIVPP